VIVGIDNADLINVDRAFNSKSIGFFSVKLILLCLLVLFFNSVSQAQHEMHNMGGANESLVMTMPSDDEVLVAAPERLMLQFDSNVTLVNLAVREPSQGKEIFDIGFRYSPVPSESFTQTLPALAAADYYVVDWAAFKNDGSLIQGTFYFSFGVDAKPPSSYRGGMDHRMEIMSPSYRLLQ
jgi:methionine-rich copper-binding protein CopC